MKKYDGNLALLTVKNVSALLVLLLFVLIIDSKGEQVAKFTFKGAPVLLNNKTVQTPEDMVAMSDYVYVNSYINSIMSGEASSIVFVIDHSGSMYQPYLQPNDPTASRFTVTSALVDSIYNMNPKTQIGLVVFRTSHYFNPADDNIFVSYPGDPSGYGYIPLLTLNATYNGKTGYEILKHYLTIKLIKTPGAQDYWGLAYQPKPEPTPGTNITHSFEAAKLAMKDSPFPAHQHFTIFLSDGEASSPDGPERFAYIKGENVPTTFTVYFTPNDTAFANLEKMTKNIQNNGYSVSNPMSDLYTIKTNHDTLMSLLMKNVIGRIVNANINSTPTGLTVNSSINPIGTWDSTGFPFAELFPLEIYNTDFAYKLDYHVIKDTINPNTGDTVTIEYDTTANVGFRVAIDPAVQTFPNTYKVDYWDRTLGFFHQGNELSSMNDSIKDVEIRFKETKIDVLYGYKDVSVTISTEEGNQTDRETFNLRSNGTYFSHEFSVEIADPPRPGDGILQVKNMDEITALFKNKKLPRDTLEIKIPYLLGNIVTAKEAYYFDNDAQGHIDSIFVKMEGDITNENVQAIVSAFVWPTFRELTIDESFALSDGVGLRVSQDVNKNPMTYVTNDDILEVKETTISLSGKVLAGKIAIADKIAPIIHWEEKRALLMDYLTVNQKDTLSVRFSEDIKDISSSEPFYFLATASNQEYQVTLNPVSKIAPDKVVFEVSSVSGVSAIVHGDSLWIHETDLVSDLKDNAQNNVKNSKRMIYVEKISGSIIADRSYYYDNNGDGFVDSIPVVATTNITGGLTASIVQELVDKALTLPAFRNFTVTGTGLTTEGFYLTVTENNTNPTTMVTSDDKLSVKSVVLSGGAKVIDGSVPVHDKVAPLIHWEEKSALLMNYLTVNQKDTLLVRFSEHIKNISSTEPFYFLATASNQEYQVTLNPVSLIAPDMMVFEISSVSGVSAIKHGDSLWIHETDLVSDIKDNAQNNINNSKRMIYVEKVYGSIMADRAFYYDNNGDGFVDSIPVVATTNIIGGLTASIVQELVDKALTLPAFRNFSVTGTGLIPEGFYLTVTESNTNPTTMVTGDDKLTVKPVVLSGGEKVTQGTITVFDKVAPLIHWDERSALAIMHMDSTIVDTLQVTFSEPVKYVNASVPFYFLSRKNSDTYTATLRSLPQSADETMGFTIESYSSSGIKIEAGDSIWIHEGDLVGDLCKDVSGNTVTNFQNNVLNTKRKVYVDKRIIPFTLIPKAVSPVSLAHMTSEVYLIPPHFIELFQTQQIFNELNLSQRSSGKYTGMIITVVPDNLENVFKEFQASGTITILDAVGNTIIKNKPMAWDEPKKRLVFAWSLMNTNNRVVGSGMYVCLFDIQETTAEPDHSGYSKKMRLMLGVK